MINEVHLLHTVYLGMSKRNGTNGWCLMSLLQRTLYFENWHIFNNVDIISLFFPLDIFSTIAKIRLRYDISTFPGVLKVYFIILQYISPRAAFLSLRSFPSWKQHGKLDWKAKKCYLKQRFGSCLKITQFCSSWWWK